MSLERETANTHKTRDDAWIATLTTRLAAAVCAVAEGQQKTAPGSLPGRLMEKMMKEYHKIDTIFKRDPANLKRIVEGDYSQDVFAYLTDNNWNFTEKVDGTNIRVIVSDGKISFGGKTDNALIPAKLVERLRERFVPQTESMLEMFPAGACLYGEGYGAKINSGGNYRQDQDFVLFDVLIGDWWLERHSVEDIAIKLRLDIVPIIGCGTLAEAVS